MFDFLQHGEQVLFASDLTNMERLDEKLRFLRAVNLRKVEALRPDLPDSEEVERELEWLSDWSALEWLIEKYRHFATCARIVPSTHLHTLLRRDGTVVFEAAQGVLLDEWLGFHPHTTWGTTTLANADTLLTEAGYSGTVRRIGITRAYSTRHGAGPFVSEDRTLTEMLPDAANDFNPWQREFRVGWLDLVMLRYAVEAAGPLDALAITCLDRLDPLPELQVCDRYRTGTFIVEQIAHSPTPRDLVYQEQITRNLQSCSPLFTPMPDLDTLIATIQETLGVPALIRSYGPTAEDKEEI
jgi:adenylosuccinate synthase